MLLVSDTENFHSWDMNVDDKLGERINIPTIIIRRKDGSLIQQYMADNPSQQVALSIKFVSISQTGMIELKLFMRSDEVKALHFFKEFRQYYDVLCKLTP
jgi:hypothetical protein